MIKIKHIVLLITGLLPFQVIAENAWTQLINDDINHIYTTVKDNHPGYVDTENAYFKAWLEQGYKEALTEAKTAQSLNDAMTIIQAYVAGFADGHFFLQLKYQPKEVKWAGIKMKRYGNDYRVSVVDDTHASSMPAAMAKLLLCDGVAVEQIVKNDVLKFRFNTPELNFPKVRYASKIFVDDGLGKRNYFESCDFEQDGAVKEFKLTWNNITNSDYINKTSSKSEDQQFSFASTEKNKYWVTLPKFYPDQEEQKALRSVIDNIKAVSSSAEQFVVDVRGNGGGNSEWGVEVAKAIYGESYIRNYQLSVPDDSYAIWRVSEGNAKHLESILPWIVEQFGKDSRVYESFSKLAGNMRVALKEGKHFVKQGGDNTNESTSVTSPVQSASNAKVLFLTDSSCGSACLDFADLMLKLPNVYHIGQETGADTVYMDIRYVDLPSGLGSYSLAQKVYRERVRKHNESYTPEYFYDSDISNTTKLKVWVNSLSVK